MRFSTGFIVGLLAACSAPAADGDANAAKATSVRELPVEHRAVLEAYSSGGVRWESERERVLADPKLARFLIENLTLELVRAHRGLSGTEPERAQAAYDRARDELVRCDALAAPTLAAFLDVADPVSASVVIVVLEEIGRAAVEPTAAVLESKSEHARRRAAEVLAHQPHAGAQAEARVRQRMIDAFEREPEWTTRTALARALAARGSRDGDVVPWRNALHKGLLDVDPAVVEASADGIAGLGDERSIPILIDVLERHVAAGDVRRTQALQRALVGLSHEPEKPSIAAWRAWWEQRARR
jgi:HEAT repeat protein